MYRVYLSGGIYGLTYDAATDWRHYAASQLAPIESLDPMRGKEYLKEMGFMPGTYDAVRLSTSRGIMTRDRFDTMRSDALLVNLLGTERVSIGTSMEIAWADMLRIPVVACMEEDNIHQHPMILEAVGYVCPTLDEGIETTKSVLGHNGAQMIRDYGAPTAAVH